MSVNAGTMMSLARQLVEAIRPDVANTPEQQEAMARRITSQIKSNSTGGMRREWTDVKKTLQGLSRSARIRVQDDVADAYDQMVRKLEQHQRRGGTMWDENLPLQVSNLPQHVHLLLELSQPTSDKTQAFAEGYLERPPVTASSDMQLFREIMGDDSDESEPGYDEEVREGWTDSESDASWSPSEEEIVTPAAKAPPAKSAARAAREAEALRRAEEEQRLLLAKLRLRDLAADAYWQTGGSSVPTRNGLRGWRALSSVPAIASPALPGRSNSRAISAGELQRELLFALSGRPGVMFSFTDDGKCSVVRGHPSVAAFTPVALEGILNTFAGHATRAGRLRALVAETAAPRASSSPRSQTAQAFSAACQSVLHELVSWVAEQEAAFLGKTPLPATATPLMLERQFTRRFGDIFDYLCGLLPLVSSPVTLLNALYAAICSPVTEAIRPALKRVFLTTAAPMWVMLGDWLVRGMPVPESLVSQEADLALQDVDDERRLEPEFFVTRDLDSAWADEDFWEAGFVVGAEGWPAWLADVEFDVLEGGKSRGLLHSLPTQEESTVTWLPLAQVISPDTDDLERALCDYVLPISKDSQRRLIKVLEWGCDLQEHLRAIDGLTLMRGFDVLDDWAEWLFSQMHSGKPWADFHLLTHSLADTIEAHEATWMNASSVRARTLRRTNADLTDIRVDYLVPFPLSQVFTGTSMDLRSDVFTFLLRLLRARKLLLHARSVAELQGGGRMDVLVSLRRIRHAAAWMLDTLWIWINSVVEIRTGRHRAAIIENLSFHALVNLELEHARGLRRLCFLHASTESSERNVDAILGVAEELFAVASTTVGVRLPTPKERRRRSRQAAPESDDDDDDDEEMEEGEGEEGTTGIVEKKHADDADEVARLHRIAETLRTQVRQLRRSVGALAAEANETPEARELWGMLAFALQDWKAPML